jgi:prolyl-tRNA synthetase
MVHGDDKGLVLPPRVAPIQVVIVPIPVKGADPTAIAAKTKEIYSCLKEKGIAVVLDDREEYTPGWKFNEWELKGVPLRIEIGPRDLKQQQAMMVRRDTRGKITVKEQDIVNKVCELLEEIQHNLYARARVNLEAKTSTVKDYEEFKKILKEKGGFIKAAWCGSAECEGKIKEETGATIRLKPFEKEATTERCIYGGEEAQEVVYFARSY